jgi:RimJ/RimL family protein N-acetyltransferase
MALLTPQLIDSDRLYLRPAQREDLPALLAVNGDDRVTRFLPYPTWTSGADGEAWYDRMASLQESGQAYQLVVVAKSSQSPIGSCLLFNHDENSQRAELGYVLGYKYWGRGFMAEALRALLDCAFGTMDLRRLEAEVNPANATSIRLLERTGFNREGLLRQRWVVASEPYDVAVYGLLRNEYQARSTPRG